MACTDSSQESFYSKLKKFADECNTNLYVSNIPKNMNEHVCYFAPTLMTSHLQHTGTRLHLRPSQGLLEQDPS